MPVAVTIAYGVTMIVIGVTALLVTYHATGSIWWAILALLLAGPATQILLRILGVPDPYPGKPRGR